jgi:hypothetical protein
VTDERPTHARIGALMSDLVAHTIALCTEGERGPLLAQRAREIRATLGALGDQLTLILEARQEAPAEAARTTGHSVMPPLRLSKPLPARYEGRVTPLDMRRAREHEHPDIKPGRQRYLCLIGGEYHTGWFSRQWFGLNFDGWRYNTAAGLQFDAHGWNGSEWEQVWAITGKE